MPRLLRTGVQVTVILGNEINVVENEAVVVKVIACLQEADVHQLGTVETITARL